MESSARAASAAICDGGHCTAMYFQNCGLTHSATLLPMAENMLKGCGMSMDDIDLVAVARGPGSFTGIRIGTAAAKGLMWGADKPGCGVSTLEAMAWQAAHMDGRLICCVMDARRGQVYNALFRARGGVPERVCPDRALSLDELAAELCGEVPLIVGDGAELCAAAFGEKGIEYLTAPESIRWQSAWGVALAALNTPPERRGDTDPVYLRLSQAERERNEKLSKMREI